MAKRTWPFAAVPVGRKVETEERDDDVLGTIVQDRHHERASAENLELARQNLREVTADEVDGYVVVDSFVDLNNPQDADVVAFAIRDGYITPLRPRGWTDHSATRFVGGVGARVIPGVAAPPSSNGPRIY